MSLKLRRPPESAYRRTTVPRSHLKSTRREPLDRRAAPVLRERPARSRANEQIDCLWLSRIGGRTVGMVRLVGAQDQAVRLSLFHIDPEWQHTAIVSNLMQYVYDFCCERGCSTLLLAPHVVPQWVPQFINGRGFQLLGRKAVAGQEIWEFRVDPGYHRAQPLHAASAN